MVVVFASLAKKINQDEWPYKGDEVKELPPPAASRVMQPSAGNAETWDKGDDGEHDAEKLFLNGHIDKGKSDTCDEVQQEPFPVLPPLASA